MIDTQYTNIKPTANEALKKMNGFFISHFFKMMYSSLDIIQTDDAFSGGSGEKIFREFLLNEYGDAMSDKFHLTTGMMEQYVKPQVEDSHTKVDA